MDSELTKLSDMGMIEDFSSEWLDEFNKQLDEL